MIFLKTPLVFVSTLIVLTLLFSRTFLDYYGATSTTSSSSIHKDKLSDGAMYGLPSGDGPSSQGDHPPSSADDVLVQRIPGDNDHMLMMAYYSKENYSGPSFTIESGYTINFRDDGQGDDKVAGDGYYTARITADVKAFREQAKDMNKQMKKDYKATKYHDRERIADPNADESFDLSKFDSHNPTSVSGMTLALSDYGPGIAGPKSKSKDFAVNGATAASTLDAVVATDATALTTLDSIKRNCIMITNVGVVEDSTRTWNYCTQKGNVKGAWTFGTLMRELASKTPTQKASDSALSVYVKNWLKNWQTTQVINGDSVKARTLVDSIVLTPWLTKSRNAGAPVGQLDMRFAPFKLIAIANRFDSRDVSPFSGVFGSGFGEGRFVFCLIDANCGGPLQFTVIFEYRIHIPNTTNANACLTRHTWAQQWVNLKNFRLGSAAYNVALQNITDQFSKCGTNTDRPNQSSLNALRTNEVAFVLPGPTNPKRWEFREFALDNSGNIKETTIGQSPADKYNAQVVNADVQRMVNYINQNQASILSIRDTVPLTLQGVPFLAGACQINGAATGQPPGAYHWDGTGSGNTSTFIKDDKTRYFFSLGTCVGCHAGETQTAFTHINPVFYGREAKLSGFLSGTVGSGGAIDFDNDSSNGLMAVKDAAMRPSTNPTVRNFNDIDRRARDLLNYVSTSCGTTLAISSQLLDDPTNMVH
jgi:hypothetical protein